MQIGDYPVVVVRGRDGRIRAFHNSCRHRGSRVCTTDKGTSARLVCPYHQWTYDLDGKLVFARQMAEDFKKEDFGLKSVACENVGGYIFICLAREPADFAPFQALMEPYFAPHNLLTPRSLTRARSSKGATGNWSGRTTANATIARRTTQSFARRFRKRPR